MFSVRLARKLRIISGIITRCVNNVKRQLRAWNRTWHLLARALNVALLRDLDSTNGTWIDLERIEQHQLSNQQEFRIGSHVLMFIVTDVE